MANKLWFRTDTRDKDFSKRFAYSKINKVISNGSDEKGNYKSTKTIVYQKGPRAPYYDFGTPAEIILEERLYDGSDTPVRSIISTPYHLNFGVDVLPTIVNEGDPNWDLWFDNYNKAYNASGYTPVIYDYSQPIVEQRQGGKSRLMPKKFQPGGDIEDDVNELPPYYNGTDTVPSTNTTNNNKYGLFTKKTIDDIIKENQQKLEIGTSVKPVKNRKSSTPKGILHVYKHGGNLAVKVDRGNGIEGYRAVSRNDVNWVRNADGRYVPLLKKFARGGSAKRFDEGGLAYPDNLLHSKHVNNFENGDKIPRYTLKEMLKNKFSSK